MKTLKMTFLQMILLALGILLLISCNNDGDDDDLFDDDGNKTTMVNFRAYGDYQDAGAGTTANRDMENLELSTFLINIRELELELDDDGDGDDKDDDGDDDKIWLGNKYDDDDDDDDDDYDDDHWDDDGYYDSDDEVELSGPFELDLLSGQLLLTSVPVPNGRFEELEFELDISSNSSSPLFGKTVLVQGSLDGIPFEFWHAFKEEVEIDFEDSRLDLNVDAFSNEILIYFDLNTLLDPFHGVDLSMAQDGNGDGLIEISPEDTDGNRALADDIRRKIKRYIRLLED